jgi:ATP-binding cassette, subfamily C (CFTR/MRP), member 1
LARAIYSRQKVTVLDDVFSGVDLNNVALITNRLFGKDGYFRQSGRSVIITASSSKFKSTLKQLSA